MSIRILSSDQGKWLAQIEIEDDGDGKIINFVLETSSAHPTAYRAGINLKQLKTEFEDLVLVKNLEKGESIEDDEEWKQVGSVEIARKISKEGYLLLGIRVKKVFGSRAFFSLSDIFINQEVQ